MIVVLMCWVCSLVYIRGFELQFGGWLNSNVSSGVSAEHFNRVYLFGKFIASYGENKVLFVVVLYSWYLSFIIVLVATIYLFIYLFKYLKQRFKLKNKNED